ncbi:MAG: hypothetical protein IKU40_00780 [Clostridia bacterium]|nr:hypothetical protein [Clostridia bacterium]
MRLFHVSEEPDIRVFEPRLPARKDLDPDVGLVWAIDEAHLPNFLTPRDCPRVAYHVGPQTTDEDRRRFFTSPENSYAVVIEAGWFSVMRDTTLFLYEFDPRDFRLQDGIAGYYVAEKTQIPVKKHVLTDLYGELLRKKVELRVTENLWNIADAVKESTLNWSLCRMKNAVMRRTK